MVAIRGVTLGELLVTPRRIIFRSTYNCVKSWKIEQVEEIVVKRHNNIKQAFEIYFTSSSSVLFVVDGKENLKEFLTTMQSLLAKQKVKANVVEKHELFFYESKFTDQWVKGVISNFKYLTLLNKYSGRSFHDINQYPVFPWLITNFTSSSIDLNSKEIYRSLDTTVAGMTELKQEAANDRVISLVKSPVEQYQFEGHYLPPSAVVGYMWRVEPYSSLASSYSGYEHFKKIMLYDIKSSWNNGLQDINDNKELVPEFYYLPEIFYNHNMHSFGNERIKEGVDRVIMPVWAKTPHEFVQANAKALESNEVSSELDKWIDLVFGVKQQDFRSYNMFKLSKEAHGENDGVNPINLFREKHPQKVLKAKDTYPIFNEEAKQLPFVLLKVKEIEEGPIVFLESFERRVVAVLDTQRVFYSKEAYVNAAYARAIAFESKGVALYPFKSFYNDAAEPYGTCDTSRSFVALQNNLIATCRHCDNSWKILNGLTGSIEKSVSFHNSMVNCICTTETKDKVFAGSNNGTVTMWTVKNFNSPLWYALDHSEEIITMDACESLDLLATAGTDNLIVLRKASNGKFISVMKPDGINAAEYTISHIRLSYRGYIIIVSKSKEAKDIISVYSVNGERICHRATQDSISSLVLSEDGYEFITGGRFGHLLRYRLLNLQCSDVLEDVAKEYPETAQVLREFSAWSPMITALNLTMREGSQQLLIGLNTGTLFAYKYSPRLIGS
eukprot:TRINITY_DN5101_c0_g1_i1.p1 TRINITY_DN5101_c0_g1~~TRINITY_DN5101_c0_g1_i1.p1  ORF type:complete len:756 (+),score=110.20 TRINITY_DN5101_c0_g1_i1:92-2269(+)